MNSVLKVVLSLSLSGSLLMLPLLLCKPLFRSRVSKRWQYAVWLAVIARLLLPFTLESSLVGALFGQLDRAGIPSLPISAGEAFVSASPSAAGPILEEEGGVPKGAAPGPAALLARAGEPEQTAGMDPLQSLGWVWLGVALILLARKIALYRGFVRSIRAGGTEVSEAALLDKLAQVGESLGVKRPVELVVCPLVPTPLLTGFFRPCIVLPTVCLPESDFQYIVLHELLHYRRRDMFYKWLVQLVLCLHWFNPLVYWMSREIARACELACDEAASQRLDAEGRRAYGDMLVHAARAGSGCWGPSPALTLNESAEQLKERLGAIMSFQKITKGGLWLSGVLTAALVGGFIFLGAYAAEPVPAESPGSFVKEAAMETLELKGTSYYLVFDEAQLRAIGTGDYGLDKNYMQQADIRLSAEWIPIGTPEHPFTGSYNGNGYAIEELTAGPGTTLPGLFGAAKNAHLYNITLRDYDLPQPGGPASGETAFPILALDVGESRCYDNASYPKQAEKGGGEDAPEFRYTQEGYFQTPYLFELGWNVQASAAAYDAVEISLPDDSTMTVLLHEKCRSRLEEADVLAALSTLLLRLREETEETRFPLVRPLVRSIQEIGNASPSELAESYYQEGGLPQFAAVFAQLDEPEQEAYLVRSYQEGKIALFSLGLQQLAPDSPLYSLLAEKTYADASVSFFSILTGYMDREALESWKAKAVQDGRANFQAVLLNAMGDEAGSQALKANLDAQRDEEYRAHGILREGIAYYYQGQRVGVLLDLRPDSSFVTLNTDPKGTVNIRIVRDGQERIQRVDEMTEAEAAELFGEEEDPEDGLEQAEKEPEGAVRLTVEELPDEAARRMENCSIKTWYRIRAGGRQYIWYNGFAWDFGYSPVRQDGGWRIEIVKFKKRDAGYLLLSLPGDAPVSVYCDGQPVVLTEADA
ncbi:MAG: M56 family metallopeptidase [Provencibacterium sp.]|jgi:beta-lactamase regulating signal transducer with metallopeptidase domain|nr:M56 family metallopeptidase [Provencibacterium sp.]